MTATDSLGAIVAGTAAEPVAPEIELLAEAVRARHEPGVVAVIAYGSSLRGVGLGDTLIDLYLLTDSFEAVSRSRLGRMACRLVPPNVHYFEVQSGGVTLRAKYAVMPLDPFVRKMRRGVGNPYFWARFAQPCRIVWVRDEAVRRALVGALAEAVRSMIAASYETLEHDESKSDLSLVPAKAGVETPNPAPAGSPPARGRAVGVDAALELWRRGLKETYRTELRPESADRARAIVAANAPYYRAVTEAVLGPEWAVASQASAASWRRRRLAGKSLSVLRLLKAAFTFEGGADYVAWKISRHSGHDIEVKPWQRRHPVLGALWLLPGLLRRGALR